MSKRGDLISDPEHVPFPVKDSNNSLDCTGCVHFWLMQILFVSVASCFNQFLNLYAQCAFSKNNNIEA